VSSAKRLPRRLCCLLAFLTRLPLPCHSIVEAAQGYPLVPLVGLLEGLVVAAAASLTSSPILAGGLGLLAHILVTGGIHLDGFADYSDAIGAGAVGQKALEIMKDPRRGGFAVSYTAAIVAARLAGLAALQGDWAAIAAGYVVAAESMYLVSILGGEPPYMGLGRLFYQLGVARESMVLNAALAAAVLLVLTPFSPLEVAAAAATGFAAALLAARDARARLGYASGDVLGFVYEAAGTAALIAAALAANPPSWW